jgi:hypothetical protein
VVEHILLADDGVKAAITSKLIADEVPVGELAGNTDITTVPLADGSFALLFLSTLGHGHFVRPDRGSASGWTQEELPSSLSLGQLVGWSNAAGIPQVFAIGPNTWAPDLFSTTRASDGTWSRWAQIPPSAAVPEARIADLAVITAAGVSDLVVITDDGSAWAVVPSTGSWTRVGRAAPRLIAGAVVAGAPGFVAVVESNDPLAFDIVFYPRPYGGTRRTLAAGVRVNALTAAESASGASAIFFSDRGNLSGKTGTWMIDGATPGAAPTLIDDRTPIAEMTAAHATHDVPVTLFAAGIDGRARFWQPGMSAADKGLFNLGWRVGDLALGFGAGGLSELVAVEPGTLRVRRFRRSAAAPSAEWVVEEVELPGKRFTTRYAHTTVFTVTGPGGDRLTNLPVDLYADERVDVNLGDRVAIAGPLEPIATTTDATGRLRVTVPTESMSTRKLRVVPRDRARGRRSATDDWVVPNAAIRRRMATLKADDLTPLVSDARTREDVAKALNRIGSAPVIDDPTARRAPAVSPGWRLTIDTTGTRFEELDRHELAAAFGAHRHPASDATGIFDFFEHVFEAIAEGVTTAVTWTVETITEGLNVLIHAVIDGVTWVANRVINLVQSAITAAESVLRAVKVVFEQLVSFFGWLLSEARKDIWYTKNALERIALKGLAQLPDLCRRGDAASHELFSQIEKWVEANFDGAIAAVTGLSLSPPELESANAPSPIRDLVAEVESTASWLWDKLMSLGGGVDGAVVPREIVDRFARFLESLSSDVVVIIRNQLDRFVEAVRGYASSVDDLGHLLLATLLTAAKDLILALLRVADSVVHAFLMLIADTLDLVTAKILMAPGADWITQGLYELVNPGPSEDITILRVACLLLAVPGTIAWRAAYGRPFREPELVSSDFKKPNEWQILSGWTHMIAWTYADLFIDRTPSQPPRPIPPPPPPATPQKRLEIGALVIGMPLLLHFLMQPGGPGSSFDATTPVEKAQRLAWWCGLFPVGYSLGVALLTQFAAGPRHPSFVAGLAVGNAFVLGMNLNRAITMQQSHEADAWDWTGSIAGPIPGIAKPIAWVQPYGRPALWVTDVVCDVTTGLAKIKAF